MKPDVVVTGIGAVTPLGVGARTLHERWTAGTSGIEDGEGACSEFEPTEHLTVKEVRRADRFTQFALVSSDEALKEAGWDGELPYDPRRDRLRSSAPGSAASARSPTTTRCMLEEGAKKVSPLSIPLMMGNAGAGAVSMRHHLHGPVVRAALGLLGRVALARRVGRADPLGPRRRGRGRLLRGRARAARPGRLRRARRDVRRRHLAPVRRPPRRLRHGRGRRGARARGRATRRASAARTSSPTCAATARRPTPTT